MGALARWFGRGRTVDMAAARPAARDLAAAIAPRSNDPDLISFLGVLPNPDRILRKLGRTEEVFEDILTDAHVASVVTSRKGAVLSREWGIRPASARRADKKAAELCERVLSRLRMRDVLTALLDAPLWGRAYLEPMWEVVDGEILPTALLQRPQRRFVYGEEEELRVLTRESRLTGDPVPCYKMLQVRAHPTYDNPYGDAALSRCFWPYAFKKAGFKWWTAFAEKYGMPWVVGTAPRGASEEEKRALDLALARAVVDAVLRVADGTKIELVQAAGTTSSQVYGEFTAANNAEISKAIVGQTLTTEVGDRGSYAAAKVHGEVRTDIAQADEALVCEGMCELLGWITELNVPGATAPDFYFYAEERPAIEWVDLVDRARKARIPVPLAWALERTGIPAVEGDEPTLELDEPVGVAGAVAEFAAMDGPIFEPLENQEAIAWLRERLVLTPEEWKALPDEMKPRAFTVGAVRDVAALRELHDVLLRTVEDGRTMRDWSRDANASLAGRGLDPLPGFLSETVFRTNAFTALAVGRYQQMRRVAEARPYWLYDAVDDDATRPEHKAMDQRVFAADDPIWRTWYPPNGMNCRCRVVSLSEREVQRRGLTVERGDDVSGQIVEVEGKAVRVVPDNGFGTNPALAPSVETIVRHAGTNLGAGLQEHIRTAVAGGGTGGASAEQIALAMMTAASPPRLSAREIPEVAAKLDAMRGVGPLQDRWVADRRQDDVLKLITAFGLTERDASRMLDGLMERLLDEPDLMGHYLYRGGRRQRGCYVEAVTLEGRELKGAGLIYDLDKDRFMGLHLDYDLNEIGQGLYPAYRKWETEYPPKEEGNGDDD